jgi:hypothetical protein
MYFDFRTYVAIVWLVLSDRPSLRRWRAHFLILPLLSLWALGNALCLLLDRALFPGLRKVRIEQPVFIVGNARSGTTFFHRLLCADEERFVYFRSWEILFPSLLQKKLLRGLARAARRAFPRRFAALRAWEGRQLPAFKAIHPLGIDKPEEDEFLLMVPFASGALTLLFPYLDRLQELVHFDSRPAPTRRRIMRFYRDCVARQIAFHGEGRTLLSKNPAFVDKLASLAEEFPDAKFVYLIRNPYETIPSLLKLVTTVWRGLGIDSDHVERTIRLIVEGCVHDYFYARQVLEKLAPERWALVEYTDLVSDPKGSVERVYRRLGLSISADFERQLDAEESRQKRYHSSNVYSLEEFGVSSAEFAEQLAPILAEFGYRPAGEPGGQVRERL